MLLTSFMFHTDQRAESRPTRPMRHLSHASLMPLVMPSPSPRPLSARPAHRSSTTESLGVASVSGRWQWADTATSASRVVHLPKPTSSPNMAALRVPPLLLEEMRAAADAHGRSLSDIWADAAREWLRRHTHEDEPQPPTPAAAALAIPMPTRSWAAIDSVLAELRRSPDTAA